MLSRFPRRTDAAVFVAAVLLAVGVTLVVVGSSLGTIGRTFPGFVVWENLVVVALGRASWTGMEAHVPYRAVVTSVDGQKVTTRDELLARVAASPPQTVHAYDFATRDGTERRDVASMRFGRGDWIATMGVYAWNGIAFLLTGLAVFYLKPELPQSRAVLAFGLVWGLTLVLAIDLFTTGRWSHLYFVVEALSPAAGLHLALAFPEPRARWRGVLPALYGVALAVGLAQSWAFDHSTALLLRLNAGVYLALGAAAVAALATVTLGAFGHGTPLVRRRARVVLAGSVVAFVVPSVPMLAFFLFGQPVSFSLLALTGFVYPLSIGYAVARHDLFEADRFVKLSIVYAALTALVSLANAGTVLAADRLALGFAVHDNPLFPVAFVLVALVTIAPLRDRVQRAVDRLFYRGRVDYKATVARVSERMTALLEPAGIVQHVVTTLHEVLGVDHVAVWERVDETFVRRGVGLREEMPARQSAVAVFEGLGRVLSRDEVEESPRLRPQRAELRALFERLGAVLLVPLMHQGRAIGLLAVGPKASGSPLSADDLDVLLTLANETAVALRTARSVAQLQAAREQLREAEHLASIGELSAAVAHGIRNPLAGIRLAAQLGREQVGENAHVRESLDDVLGAVDRLEAQVRGILDFARPFEPRLERVEVAPFLEDFRTQILPQCQDRRVRVAVHVPPGTRAMRADAIHLRQVLHELVRNALEAMPEGGTLTFAAADAGGDEPRVRLETSDTGPGVPPAQKERIFRLFATTKSGGTGVGLAVARKIVERHGGRLTLASEAPEPARFVIELPAADPS
jgi:signal transduction histidine kinase